MSLASYTGCNVEISFTDPDSNDVIIFGPCFSILSYTYEIKTIWGIELVDWQNEEKKKEAKKKL
ncbi:KH domain-containing protein [Bacillus dicomae]|uniref:Uncharacterized protein n=1 Tax=Bacillus dicomae TaxID=3088378 RepID=A0AC61TCH5_9BACI|nr:hypothetical protein [Bacillus dicomae]TPV47103.1 hypothetical protein FJ659_07675 [Bacillus dicomae]